MRANDLEELRLCHAACRMEAALADAGTRRINAEALQRALIRNADAIVRALEDRESDQLTITRLAAALAPFARAAGILVPGQNPVLLSLPTKDAGGRTFVQLRPEDFRRAAAIIAEIRP